MTALLQIITDAAGLTDEQGVAVLRAISGAGFTIINQRPTDAEMVEVGAVVDECVAVNCREAAKHAWKQVAATGIDRVAAMLAAAPDVLEQPD